MRIRTVAGMLAAGAILGGLTGLTRADAQTPIPDCGGEGMVHTVPEGGVARCAGSRILQDGLRWTDVVEVRDDGTFGVLFRRPVPATTDIFVELEAHLDGSGNGEAGILTGFLPAGQTEVILSGKFDPAVLLPYDCITQTDAKAINGNADKPTPPNQNRVRVSGGWFQFEDCSAPVETVPTSAPATGPTSAPGTGVTTIGSSASQVTVRPGQALPATDRFDLRTTTVIALVMVGAGGVILLTRKRKPEQV